MSFSNGEVYSPLYFDYTALLMKFNPQIVSDATCQRLPSKRNPYGLSNFDLFSRHMEMEERLKRTVVFVEATGNESHRFWEQDHVLTPRGKNLVWNENPSNEWLQVGNGCTPCIGEIKYKNKQWPVNVSFSWNFVNGYPICFWNACSQMVFYPMIDEFLAPYKKPFKAPGYRVDRVSDSNNFHNALQGISELRRFVADKGLQALKGTSLEALADYESGIEAY